MGGSTSKDATVATSNTNQQNQISACPVQHNNNAVSTNNKNINMNQKQSFSSSACPVVQSTNNNNNNENGIEFNVYSQPIDPSNQMPFNPNQMPSPGQTKPLSTERVSSNIPKGILNQKENEQQQQTWTYPSPQMFYNALARKGKLNPQKDNNNQDDDEQENMETVVALHNNMNERTWRQIVEWERLAGESNPKLLKFMGRPADLSPKARFKHLFLGHPLPFDRHDWTILRSNNKTEQQQPTLVRYVIDYYHDDSCSSEEEGSGMPDLMENNVPSLLMDVRPALDSPSSLYQRVFNAPYARFTQQTALKPLPLMPTSALRTQVGESQQVWNSIQKDRLAKTRPTTTKEEEEEAVVISNREAMALSRVFETILQDCQQQQTHLDKVCGNNQDSPECAKASIDLTLCMGKQWCPLQHSAVVRALNQKEDDGSIDVALENLSQCVHASQVRTHEAKQQHPNIFSK